MESTATATNSIVKNWGDSTIAISYFENLNLPSDRKWSKVTIEAIGTGEKQKFNITLKKNGSHIFSENSLVLPKGGRWKKEITVNDICSLEVTGELMKHSFLESAGRVILTGYYETTEFESVSQSWRDDTAGKSFINLELPAEHRWTHATLRCSGHQNKSTGVKLALIASGELVDYPKHASWNVIDGTGSISREFKIEKKTSLSVAGYITNNKVAAGGGADVYLTAYYKKGE